MQIVTLRLSGFQSFGPKPTEVSLQAMTYVLGPNGAGKTAVLTALSRLFSPLPNQRRIRVEDFHVPAVERGAERAADQPTLWIEADIVIPEAGDDGQHASVPPCFAHMRIDGPNGVPRMRVRLTATLAADGIVDEQIDYVLRVDDAGEPVERATMSRHDRGYIEVHYLPARRNPVDHIAYTAASLLGRTMRAVDWTDQRDVLRTLSGGMTNALAANSGVKSVGDRLSVEWAGLHRGEFFRDPSITFGRGDIDSVLRQITVSFSPTHDGEPLPFDLLSDGQKSLLYISLVLAWQSLSRRVLQGEETSMDASRLRPPVHTVLALEEPENSLAPQYLGRIVKQIRSTCAEGDAQALLATHTPTLIRRVDPASIRFLRLNEARETVVRTIRMPAAADDAAKFVREAVEAYPELYFARLVILGEGDSELVVLPRLLAAAGIAEDDASVAVVPLGGRHVNHFWNLLSGLDIPFVTLIDLDAGRHAAGWGRVRYAMNQVNAIRTSRFAKEVIDHLPAWNSNQPFPDLASSPIAGVTGPLQTLESEDVFFSHPVDLDLMLLDAFPDAYEATRRIPDEKTIVSVLGPNHTNEARLEPSVLELFDAYHAKFDLKSKPATHLGGMSALSDAELLAGLPKVLERLVDRVRQKLAALPE